MRRSKLCSGLSDQAKELESSVNAIFPLDKDPWSYYEHYDLIAGLDARGKLPTLEDLLGDTAVLLEKYLDEDERLRQDAWSVSDQRYRVIRMRDIRRFLANIGDHKINEDQFQTCHKCSVKRLLVYQVRDRAGDEPYSKKSLCFNCGFNSRSRG